MSRSCDALVVGGGPAGSTCARALVRAGLDVIVLDKCTFPRDKPCAGWITPHVLDLLAIDPDEYRAGRVLQPITGFQVCRLGGRETEARYNRVISFGVRRCEFDHYLLQRSGARTRLGEPLRSLERRGRRWLADGNIETPLVIGAGGHFCPVARHLGAQVGRDEPAVAAQEIEFAMSDAQADACPVRPDTPELYFCEDLQGYGWCFRKDGHLNVGLGREDPQRLAEHLRRFIERLQKRGRVPRDLPARFRGHAYILYGHARRTLFDDGVLLVGDAAGLAYPYSGEGIRTAIESGQLAADAIRAASGDYAADRLRPYADALIARFGPPESSDGWLAHVPSAIKQMLGRALFGSPWFVRHVVLNRWFLHANE